MKTIKVDVTKQDIKRGQRESADNCPIALALKRQGYDDIEVLEEEVLIHNYNFCEEYNISKTAQKFIYNFDNKKVVKPSTFILKSRWR